MKLLEIMSAPWMLAPEQLAEIQAIYQSHLRGDKIDIKGIVAKVAAQESPVKGYDVIDGAAIITIDGIISKKRTFWSYFFGGSASSEVAQLFSAAMADPAVESILLDIDSPGGTVDGTQELAELIFSYRGQKPIIAWTDGKMASAAYYIGAAADAIYISGDMPDIGAIGVTMLHVDYSEAARKAGVRETDIYAGRYKRIASSNRPLSGEGKAYLQDQVDYVYSVFVNDIARFRNKTVVEVLEKMADGRIFIGRQAIKAGLADGVSARDRLLSITLPVLQRAARDQKWLLQLNTEAKKWI